MPPDDGLIQLGDQRHNRQHSASSSPRLRRVRVLRHPEPPIEEDDTLDVECHKQHKARTSCFRCSMFFLIRSNRSTGLVRSLLLLPLTVFLIVQIERSSQRYLNSSNQEQVPIAAFDPKPLALELNAKDGSVLPIDLGWFRIKERDIRATAAAWRFVNNTAESLNTCRPMYDWQETFFPTCNMVHEMDLLSKSRQNEAQMVNHGYARDVWEYKQQHDDSSTSSSWALKTLRYNLNYTERFLQDHQTDSILSERLTFSPAVANIYGYCGMAAVYDFAHDGTLLDHYKNLSQMERLRTAAFISKGLADLHTLGGGPFSPAVHTDIDARQFIYLNGNFLLNDFNTAGLLYLDERNKDACTWTMFHPHDKNRSPEEHMAETNYVNEKIDVYSLGNIFYKLLMNKEKYNDITTSQAEALILKGDIPRLSNELEASNDPIHVALKNAMHKCLTLDPKERPSASQVAHDLQVVWRIVKKQKKNAHADHKTANFNVQVRG